MSRRKECPGCASLSCLDRKLRAVVVTFLEQGGAPIGLQAAVAKLAASTLCAVADASGMADPAAIAMQGEAVAVAMRLIRMQNAAAAGQAEAASPEHAGSRLH